ncbi:MAG: hypothetical protein ACRC9K_12280 [Afipia sp.]
MIWGRIALWFATSKTGQYIAAGLALAAAIGVAVLKVFNSGKAAERAKQDRQSLENLRERAATNDEIHSLGPDDVRDRLDRWSVPDDK